MQGTFIFRGASNPVGHHPQRLPVCRGRLARAIAEARPPKGLILVLPALERADMTGFAEVCSRVAKPGMGGVDVLSSVLELLKVSVFGSNPAMTPMVSERFQASKIGRNIRLPIVRIRLRGAFL